MRWVEHVARMGEKRNAYRDLLGKPERDNFEHLGVVGRIILKCIIVK
jgi:hypothetical protein